MLEGMVKVKDMTFAETRNQPPWPLCQILECLKASCKGDGSVNWWGGDIMGSGNGGEA